MNISLSRRSLPEFDASEFVSHEERELIYSIVKLDMSFNRLSLVNGMQCLHSLTDLDLSHNRVTSLKGLPLKLRKLNVSHNNLTSLDGLTPLSQLEDLTACHNALTSLHGLPPSPSMRTLKVSHNRLASLRGVEVNPSLHELNVGSNLFQRPEDVQQLKYLVALRHLTVSNNPVVINPRNVTAMKAFVPRLSTLDGIAVVATLGLTTGASSASLLGSARRRSSSTGSRPTSPTGRGNTSVQSTRSAASVRSNSATARPSSAQGSRPSSAQGPRPTTPPTVSGPTGRMPLRATQDNRPAPSAAKPKHVDAMESSAILRGGPGHIRVAAQQPSKASHDVSVPTGEAQRLLERRVVELEQTVIELKAALEHSNSDNAKLRGQVASLRATADKHQTEFSSLQHVNKRLMEDMSNVSRAPRVDATSAAASRTGRPAARGAGPSSTSAIGSTSRPSSSSRVAGGGNKANMYPATRMSSSSTTDALLRSTRRPNTSAGSLNSSAHLNNSAAARGIYKHSSSVSYDDVSRRYRSASPRAHTTSANHSRNVSFGANEYFSPPQHRF